MLLAVSWILPFLEGNRDSFKHKHGVGKIYRYIIGAINQWQVEGVVRRVCYKTKFLDSTEARGTGLWRGERAQSVLYDSGDLHSSYPVQTGQVTEILHLSIGHTPFL
jgi:hypothetical protein